MPELPEVEVTRRGLAAPLLGALVQGVEMGKPLRWPLGVAPEALVGARIGQLQRRGKYLWMPLEPERGGLLMHLGMSGSLNLNAAPVAAAGHVHFVMHTSQGCLSLTDPRRFGAVLWSPSLQLQPAATLLARLGHEPFDEALTAPRFHAALQARRTPIKALLLGGEVIVGAGNIYACEALHAAAIHPAAPSHRIGPARAERLLAAVRHTLHRALQLGGSTLRDFRDAHGMDGAYQQQAAVYDREGEPCPRCSARVKRVVQAQRSTYYCPRCQRM